MYRSINVSQQFRSVQKSLDAFREMINTPIGSNSNAPKFGGKFVHSKFSEKRYQPKQNIYKMKNHDSIYSDSDYDSESSFHVGKKAGYHKNQDLLSDYSSLESESSYVSTKKQPNRYKYHNDSDYLDDSYEYSYYSISSSCHRNEKIVPYQRNLKNRYLSSESTDSDDSIVVQKQFNFNIKRQKKPQFTQKPSKPQRKYLLSTESSSSDDLINKKTKYKHYETDSYSSEMSTYGGSSNLDSEYDSVSSSFIYPTKRKPVKFKQFTKTEIPTENIPTKAKGSSLFKNNCFLSESSNYFDSESSLNASADSYSNQKVVTFQKFSTQNMQSSPKSSQNHPKSNTPVELPQQKLSFSPISYKINENSKNINNVQSPAKYLFKNDFLSTSSIEEIENSYQASYRNSVQDKSVKFVPSIQNNPKKGQQPSPIQPNSINKAKENQYIGNQYIARFTHFHSTYPNVSSQTSKGPNISSSEVTIETQDQQKDEQISFKESFNMQNISDNFTDSDVSDQLDNNDKVNTQTESKYTKIDNQNTVRPQFEYNPSKTTENENSEEIINDEDDEFPIDSNKNLIETKLNKQSVSPINETDSMNFADESRIDDDDTGNSQIANNNRIHNSEKLNSIENTEKSKSNGNEDKSSMNTETLSPKTGSNKSSILGEIDDDSDDADIQELLRLYGKEEDDGAD